MGVDTSHERRVLVLGSTGSVGTQTLDVVDRLNELHARGLHPRRYRVVGLAAGRNIDLLRQQASRFALPASALAIEREEGLDAGSLPRLRGRSAAEHLVRDVEADVVVAAIVGAAGLPSTLAAVELGRDVALANKESLVAAGAVVVPAARRSGSRLLPVDSEHSAVWQCLKGERSSEASSMASGSGGACAPIAASGAENASTPVRDSGSWLCVPPCAAPRAVSKIILTASGGPFRTWTRDAIREATPEQALRHPNWRMGAKITVDCATLMNKGLELIEAHWLFGVGSDSLAAVVHPQSIVHALVEFVDGTLLAQLAPPDMAAPIRLALAFPDRPEATGAKRLSLTELGRLDFEPPDLNRFPALGLARRVLERPQTTLGAIVNAANEEAVMAFLDGERASRGVPRVRFGDIATIAARVADEMADQPVRTLHDVLAADAEARERARRMCDQRML
ncbi:MAG: 1-deoxy-D-xylulose-5-phosphate reductoisomerase [Planctomycetota bacterium]|nr:1-deoxy-D-xylulose-5-phosphate reductoisomerase [Planctomycetota bacterium]